MKVGALVLAFLLATITITESTKETSNDDLHAQLVDLQRRHVDWLLDHPDVTAVDVNRKTVGGEQTDQLSLVIWVKKKLPEEDVLENRRLPREIEGFQTDVVEGEIELANGNCTCRPSLEELRGGDCIKIKNSKSSGTLGYFTRRVGDPTDIGILSNCHVTGEIGNIITSRPCGRSKATTNRKTNRPQHYVATVTVSECDDIVDASHSTLCTDPPEFMLKDGTVVPGTQTANENDTVRFCGCTSGCTNPGIIISTTMCINIDCLPCDSTIFRRCNQILFTPAAMPGDSGSLLINADTNNATGLVYGRTTANPMRGIATPINAVLGALGVTLA